MEDRFAKEVRHGKALSSDVERGGTGRVGSDGIGREGGGSEACACRILLLADQGPDGPSKSDPEIVDALGCGRATVERVRKQFVEEGVEATLHPKPTIRTYERRLDGKAEAHLLAISCGAPPEGQARWTLRLLADRMVGLGHVESLSHETVRQTLKKTNSSRG